MARWFIDAFISIAFAGFTSVIAKLGDVSTAALIDKSGVVIAVPLSFWVLHEAASIPELIVAGPVSMVRG